MASPIDPSYQFANVTPSDTLVLKYNGVSLKCRGISLAVAGDLAVTNDLGTTVVIPSGALSAGAIHPISTDKVLSTGTTATGITVYF